MTAETVVLAYSGGLDTSCILKWLLDRGYKVVCYMANVGQEEDFEAARCKATAVGATEVVIDDLRRDFVENYVWPAVRMGLIYENRYLLGTSLARPCISVGLMQCVEKYKARFISHGATGKGNDQVRFELSCYSLNPTIKVLAPWRMHEFCQKFQGRPDLINYAKSNGIPVSATPSAPWSMDANLMHISYESGVLEDPSNAPPKDLFQMTKSPRDAPDSVVKVNVTFENGNPTCVEAEGKRYENPLDMFVFLNQIGSKNGIGRIDIVENRFIGLKSRGVYETPAGHILHVAHLDLEVYCLDRQVLRLKQYMADQMADFVYNGLWFSPEAMYARKCLEHSQEGVTGSVYLELYKGNATVVGRSSRVSLYNEDLVSMDKHAEFSPVDATGFINIQAIRLKEFHRFQKEKKHLSQT